MSRVACPPAPPSRLPGLREVGEALERLLRSRAPGELPGPGRRAAVLLVLYEHDGRPHLLLTKRADTMASHAGQVSLPGGVAEPGDPGPRETALRETEEEVGIPPDALRVIGELDDVHTLTSGYIIRPVVAVMEAPLAPFPSDAEVARVMEAPLAELLRADAELPAEPAPLALRYPLCGEDVWGATARILRVFSRLARCALGDEERGKAAY